MFDVNDMNETPTLIIFIYFNVRNGNKLELIVLQWFINLMAGEEAARLIFFYRSERKLFMANFKYGPNVHSLKDIKQ